MTADLDTLLTALYVLADDLCSPAQSFATRAQARTAIFEYLECFRNPVRRHSSLGQAGRQLGLARYETSCTVEIPGVCVATS